MVDFEEEHKQSMQMNDKVKSEHHIAEMVEAKISEHASFIENMAQETEMSDRNIEQTKALHETAILKLRERVVEVKTRKEHQPGEVNSALEEEERANQSLRIAEDERRRIEATLIQIREELTEEDAAGKQVLAQLEKLAARREEQRAAEVHLKQEAEGSQDKVAGELGRVVQLVNQHEEDFLAERAQHEQVVVDLQEAVEEARKRVEKWRWDQQASEEAGDAREKEREPELARLQSRMIAQKDEVQRLRMELERQEHEVDKVKRSVEEHVQDERTILEAASRVRGDTEAVISRAEGVERELGEIREQVRAQDAERQDVRSAEEELVVEFQRLMQVERDRVAELEGRRAAKDAESKRCYESLLKLSEAGANLATRQQHFAERHLRHLARLPALTHVHEDLRARLRHVGSLSGDMLFAEAAPLTLSIQDSLARLDALATSYRTRRAALDSRPAMPFVPPEAAPSHHTAQLLRSSDVAIPPAAAVPNDDSRAASYTDQLLRSAPPQLHPQAQPKPQPQYQPRVQPQQELQPQPQFHPQSHAQAIPSHTWDAATQPGAAAPFEAPSSELIASHTIPGLAETDDNDPPPTPSNLPPATIGMLPPSTIGTPVRGIATPHDGRHKPDPDGVIRLRVAVTDYIPLSESPGPLRKASPASSPTVPPSFHPSPRLAR